MRHLERKGSSTAEILFLGAFFVVYAFLLLEVDPEWLIWAGPITLGALPVGAPKVAPAFNSLEMLQSASFLVLPGLLALIFLVRIPGTTRRSADSAAAKPAGAIRVAEAHGIPEHRKAA